MAAGRGVSPGAGLQAAQPAKGQDMAQRRALKAVRISIAVAIAACGTGARAELRDVAQVSEGLIAAAIAYEIGDKCGPLDVRLMRGLTFLNGLKSHAVSLGYSDAEIDAYIDDAAEQDRLEAVARQRLRDLGAVEGDAESYCGAGRAQIAAGSQIGQFLR